jgi:hypothetical protein
MSDGGSIRTREQQADNESAEPPSIMVASLLLAR